MAAHIILTTVSGSVKAETIVKILIDLGMDAKFKSTNHDAYDDYLILVHPLSVASKEERIALKKIIESIEAWFQI